MIFIHCSSDSSLPGQITIHFLHYYWHRYYLYVTAINTSKPHEIDGLIHWQTFRHCPPTSSSAPPPFSRLPPYSSHFWRVGMKSAKLTAANSVRSPKLFPVTAIPYLEAGLPGGYGMYSDS